MDALVAANLAAIMVLSIKTGAVLGASWLGGRQIFLVSLSFGALLFVLSRAMWPYAPQLAWLVEQYTFPFSVVMAVLFIYLGLGGNCQENTCQRPGKLYFGALLPCPFCLLALAFGLILLKQRFGDHYLLPDLIFSAALTLFLLAVALGVRRLSSQKMGASLKNMNMLLLLLGTTTLVMVFLVPNLVRAARMSFSRVQVDYFPVMLAVWAAGCVLVGGGYLAAHRKR